MVIWFWRTKGNSLFPTSRTFYFKIKEWLHCLHWVVPTKNSEHRTRHSYALPSCNSKTDNVKIDVYNLTVNPVAYMCTFITNDQKRVFTLYQVYRHLSLSLKMQQEISQYSRVLYRHLQNGIPHFMKEKCFSNKTRKLTNLQIFNYRGIVVYSLSVHSFSHSFSIKSKLLHCLLLCKVRSFVEQLPRRLVLEPRHMEKSGRGANFCGHGYLVSERLKKVKQ